MNGRKAKLLRKIAALTGRTDTYIKREYKRMPRNLQESYLTYMKENLRRIESLRQLKPKNTEITLDTKDKEGE
jgi:hypothetical protein